MRRTAFALAAVLTAAAGRARAQNPLVELPLDDPAYTQLDGLARQGCAAARVSPFRPYFVGDVRRALGAASKESACRGALLDALAHRFPSDSAAPRDTTRSGLSVGGVATLRATGLKNGEFEPLWKDVRAADSGDQPAVGVARLRITYDGGPHFVAVSEAFAQSGVRNDPHNRDAPFRRTSGVVGFNDAYLTGQLGKLIVSIGRTREAWLGEGDESLVLSANGPAYDRLLFSIRFWKMEFRSFASTIDDVVLDTTRDELPANIVQQRWHRFLFAHGLTYRPTPNIELTVGETALVPRQGFTVDLGYLNPLMLYQTTQHDPSQSGGGDPNLTGFFAARATLGRATVRGELLLDDYQLDAKDKDIYPNQLGWNLEATYAPRLPLPVTIGAQYRRIDAFTYVGQSEYSKVYQQFNQPIGSELGPDADMIRGYAELWASGRLRVNAGLSRWRHGGHRIDERPAVNRTGHANEPFPDTTAARPVVQRAWLGDASAQWLDGVLPITARVELARIDNVNGVAAPAKNYARVQLLASWRFRYP